MENETFDANALNEQLNTPTDNTPAGYGAEPEEESTETVEASDDTPAEEPAEEAVEEEHEEAEEEAPKPLSRGQQRIQNLANEKRLAEQRAEMFERQLEYERQQRQAPQRAQEEENLTDLEKWQRQADQTIRQVQFQNMDMNDRSNFLMAVSKNPAEAAYIDRVEQRLAEARKQGFNPTREDVLYRLMGEDARNKLKAAPAVKREAAQRVKAATGKPLVSKSNVAPTKTESTEYDRLKGVIL